MGDEIFNFHLYLYYQISIICINNIFIFGVFDHGEKEFKIDDLLDQELGD